MIGSGPASISAAETVRSVDPLAGVVIVCAEPHGYYSRPGLAYFLADEVPSKRLFPFTTEDLSDVATELVFDRAVKIDPAAHRVTLERGRVLDYDRLLIATGSQSVPLVVPGADLDGVVKLDDLDDAVGLLRRGRRARAAVVVGGGITALEIVEGLRARGVEVHYLLRKDRYWGNVLSESESILVERGLLERRVQIHRQSELAEVLGREGRVVGVKTDTGESIPCDLVAAAIGVLPEKGLAESAGLECGRGVLVDEHLCSTDPDIFAAGDVAEARDPVSGRRTLEVLWSSAVSKGRVAGANMCGVDSVVYQKGLALNVTRLAGIKTTIIGSVGSGADTDLESISRGDSETWRGLGEALILESQSGDVHIRLALIDGAVAGAVLMGDQQLSVAIQDLVAARADLSGIIPQLSGKGAPVASLVEAFWNEWSVGRA